MFGLNINIETKLGHYRQKPNKEPHIMTADYGDIAGTRGNDGDPIDVFVGLFKNSKQIFIANKYNKDGTFDEHKVLLGFFDREQAVNVYKTAYSWHKIDDNDIVELTESQFLFWLKYAKKNAPIMLENLPFDPLNKDITMTNITATYDWANEQKAAAKIVYDMRQTDQDEQLLEQMEIYALAAELAENGDILSGAEDVAFDSLVIQNKALPRKVNLIGKALNSAGSSLSVVENGVQISKPYRSNGVTQIAAVFELSDGQTVSIMLHNQDATPSKLTPEDNLIAWRWLLNKKDITIVVAKENGRDQNIRLIARKVMLLAEKNAEKFAKANLSRQERKEALQKEQSEIEALELELKQLIEKSDGLKEQIKMKRESGASNENQGDNNQMPTKETVEFINAKDFLLETIFDGNKDKVLVMVKDGDGKIVDTKLINNNKTDYTKAYNALKSKHQGEQYEVKSYPFSDIEVKNAPVGKQEQTELERSANLLKELGYSIDYEYKNAANEIASLPAKVGDYFGTSYDGSDKLKGAFKVLEVKNLETTPFFEVEHESGYINDTKADDIQTQISSGKIKKISEEEFLQIKENGKYSLFSEYIHKNGKPAFKVYKNGHDEYWFDEDNKPAEDFNFRSGFTFEQIEQRARYWDLSKLTNKSGHDFSEPKNGADNGNSENGGEPNALENGNPSSDNQDDDDADTKLLKRVASGDTTPEELGDIDFLQSALDVAKNHGNEELKLAALNALREPMKQLLIEKLAATQ